MKDTVITLIKEVPQKDENGIERTQETGREVMATLSSVTRSEFFGGGRAGLNPSGMFSVFSADYDDETILRHEGKSYAIYRTYQPPGEDYIELYCQREGGTNGKGYNT